MVTGVLPQFVESLLSGSLELAVCAQLKGTLQVCAKMSSLHIVQSCGPVGAIYLDGTYPAWLASSTRIPGADNPCTAEDQADQCWTLADKTLEAFRNTRWYPPPQPVVLSSSSTSIVVVVVLEVVREVVDGTQLPR